MSGSEYYDNTTFPAQGAAGSSSAMRAELQLIEAGFGKLPDLSGNGLKIVAVNSTGTGLEATTSFIHQTSVVTTQFDVVSSTTLANVPGLSVDLVTGKTYEFIARMYLSNTSGGNKFLFSGTATNSSYLEDATFYFANSIETITNTSTGGTLGNGTACKYVEIRGIFVCNGTGTLLIQYAQNVSHITTSSVLVGSNLTARRLA